MSVCLVTGGAGFIGTHVANRLLKKGKQVIVLDDLSGGFVENIHKDSEFIKGSITDDALVDNIFKTNRIDYVFHIAAYAAEGLSHFIRRFNYSNNLMGSVNLINESIKSKVKCFVFTSSIAVYGTGRLPLKEDMVPMPEDPYAIAKIAVESDLKVAHEMFGLNYLVFRPHNVYGEYQNLGDKYRNVVGIFMNHVMQNKELRIFGDGEQTRAFSYIGDVAPVIAESIENKDAYNNVYNIGGDNFHTVNELAQVIKKTYKSDVDIVHLPARNEVKHAYSEHSKLERYFGKKETTSLENGINKMWAWAKKTGIKGSKKFDNIEIMENLPEIWLED